MRKYQVDYNRYYFNAEDEWGDYDNGKYRGPWFNKKGYSIKNYLCTDGKWHSMEEHLAKWEFFNGKTPEGLQIDHITPIKNGGTNALSNLRLITHKGNCQNPISRQNHSDAKKELWKNEEYRNKMLTIRNSEEFREKLSKSHSGKKWKTSIYQKQCKPVYQYTLNGELINIWQSGHMIERELGFSRERISFHCKDGKPYKGYRWSYVPL